MSDDATPQLRIGGLMRCCTETWAQEVEQLRDATEPIQCQYSNDSSHQMVLAQDGIWEWMGYRKVSE